jgi:hypothetical protein
MERRSCGDLYRRAQPGRDRRFERLELLGNFLALTHARTRAFLMAIAFCDLRFSLCTLATLLAPTLSKQTGATGRRRDAPS